MHHRPNLRIPAFAAGILALAGSWSVAAEPPELRQSQANTNGRMAIDTTLIEDQPLTLKISGHVYDADTGYLVARCRVIPTSVHKEDADHITWQTQHLREFAGGEYVYESQHPPALTKLRIEADGYRPAITHAVREGQSTEIDVMLIREVLAGTVLLPDGKPAANAQLAIASYTNEVTIRTTELSYRGHATRLRRIVETDWNGRFELPTEIDPSTLIVAHESGYAEQTIVAPSENTPVRRANYTTAADKGSLKIQLKPWGRVAGRIQMRDQPVADARFCLYQGRHDHVFVWASQTATSDSKGRFVVDHLPPGPNGVCLRCVDGTGDGGNTIIGLPVAFEILSGKETPLELGCPGRTLVGRLLLPDDFPNTVDWTKVSMRVFPKAPHFSGRLDGGNGPLQCWSRFLQTEEGKIYVRETVAIDSRGRFRIEGLPPAEYQLMISADEKAVSGGLYLKGELLRGSSSFPMPPTNPGDRPPDPVDIGAIRLTATVLP